MGGFPTQRARTCRMFSISWHHHELECHQYINTTFSLPPFAEHIYSEYSKQPIGKLLMEVLTKSMCIHLGKCSCVVIWENVHEASIIFGATTSFVMEMIVQIAYSQLVTTKFWLWYFLYAFNLCDFNKHTYITNTFHCPGTYKVEYIGFAYVESKISLIVQKYI